MTEKLRAKIQQNGVLLIESEKLFATEHAIVPGEGIVTYAGMAGTLAIPKERWREYIKEITEIFETYFEGS